MARFRKKPIVIEAVKWTGDNIDEIIAFIGVSLSMEVEEFKTEVAKKGLFISTLEGQMCAKIGDWIIQGIAGEFYPCGADIFTATYEPTLY